MSDINTDDLIRQFGNNYPSWIKSAIGSQLDSMNQQLQRIGVGSDKVEKQLKAVEQEKRALNNNYKNLNSTVKQLLDETKKKVVEERKHAPTNKNLAKANDEYLKKIQTMEKSLDGITASMNPTKLNASVKDTTNKISSWSDSLVSNSLIITGVAGAFGLATKGILSLYNIIEDTRVGYTNLIASGISINDGFLGLRKTMASSGYTLEMLTNIVGSNTKLFNTMGTTALEAFTSINHELRKLSSVSTKYGMSFQDIDEYLVEYLEIERLRGTLMTTDRVRLAKSSEQQLKVMTEYTSILGKTRKELLKEIQDSQRAPIKIMARSIFAGMGEVGEKVLDTMKQVEESLSATVGDDSLRKLFDEIFVAKELQAKGQIGFSKELYKQYSYLQNYAPEIYHAYEDMVKAIKGGNEIQIKESQAKFVQASANLKNLKNLETIQQASVLGIAEFVEMGTMLANNQLESAKYSGKNFAETMAIMEADRIAKSKEDDKLMVMRNLEELAKKFRSLTQTIANEIMDSNLFAKVINTLNKAILWLEPLVIEFFNDVELLDKEINKLYLGAKDFVIKFYHVTKDFFTIEDANGLTSFDKLVSAIGTISAAICNAASAFNYIFDKSSELYNYFANEFPNKFTSVVAGIFTNMPVDTMSNVVDSELAAMDKEEPVEIGTPMPKDVDILTPDDKLDFNVSGQGLSQELLGLNKAIVDIDKQAKDFNQFAIDQKLSKQYEESFKNMDGILKGYQSTPKSSSGTYSGPRIGGSSSSSPSPSSINVPHLAKGGVVTGDTIARIGEGTSPEVVMPLDPAMNDLAKEIGKQFTQVYGPFENKILEDVVSKIFSKNAVPLNDVFTNVLDKFFFSKNDIEKIIDNMRNLNPNDSKIMDILKAMGYDPFAGFGGQGGDGNPAGSSAVGGGTSGGSAASKLDPDSNGYIPGASSQILSSDKFTKPEMNETNGSRGKSVLEAKPGVTTIEMEDGGVVRRSGDRNWRNNNPGNIEYGPFARSHGAIGTDGRFAVFPDHKTGREAKKSLLFEGVNYKDKSISGAISRYAPPSENNTGAYINAVASALGISPNTRLSDLTPEQREVMMDAMQKVEGTGKGRETIIKKGTPSLKNTTLNFKNLTVKTNDGTGTFDTNLFGKKLTQEFPNAANSFSKEKKAAMPKMIKDKEDRETAADILRKKKEEGKKEDNSAIFNNKLSSRTEEVLGQMKKMARLSEDLVSTMGKAKGSLVV